MELSSPGSPKQVSIALPPLVQRDVTGMLRTAGGARVSQAKHHFPPPTACCRPEFLVKAPSVHFGKTCSLVVGVIRSEGSLGAGL